jgi:hypothetical protein
MNWAPPLRPALGDKMMSVGFLELSGFDHRVTAFGMEPRGSRAGPDFQVPQWYMLVKQIDGSVLHHNKQITHSRRSADQESDQIPPDHSKRVIIKRAPRTTFHGRLYSCATIDDIEGGGNQ